MANRDRYIERDRYGNERLVIRTSPRPSSSRRMSTRELLNAAEEREEVLIIRNEQLVNQLAWAQAEERRAKEECGQLAARLQAQAEATRQIRDQLNDEKARTAALETRVRLMQRTSGEGYRQRNEALAADMENMRAALRDRDEALRLSNIRLDNKTQTIVDLKAHLMRLGYRVVGD